MLFHDLHTYTCFSAGLDSRCRAFNLQIEGFKSRQNLASLTGHRCWTQPQVPFDKLFGETVTVHIAGEKLTHTSVEELHTRTFGKWIPWLKSTNDTQFPCCTHTMWQDYCSQKTLPKQPGRKSKISIEHKSPSGTDSIRIRLWLIRKFEISSRHGQIHLIRYQKGSLIRSWKRWRTSFAVVLSLLRTRDVSPEERSVNSPSIMWAQWCN
jgi:hypothetical protein